MARPVALGQLQLHVRQLRDGQLQQPGRGQRVRQRTEVAAEQVAQVPVDAEGAPERTAPRVERCTAGEAALSEALSVAGPGPRCGYASASMARLDRASGRHAAGRARARRAPVSLAA